MFIGHLPAGYLAGTAAQRVTGLPLRAILIVSLVASVLPDTDLLWFYAVDNRQNPHHDYLFHAPLFWVAVVAALWLIARVAGIRHAGLLAVVALLNLELHMLLDTIAGGIRWLWPFSDRSFVMATVEPGYQWWVWNFVLHWTFALELAVVIAALIVLVARRRT